MYKGFQAVSFTACVKDRQLFFTGSARFSPCEQILLSELTRFECAAEVYLFMPDHVHLLLRGVSGSADVLKAMRSFKQKTGFWVSRNHPNIHWQKDFYDHILRDEAELETHIRYILNNPVRKGLAERWLDYPFKGSTVHNLCDWQ